jgi:hypothetical protein
MTGNKPKFTYAFDASSLMIMQRYYPATIMPGLWIKFNKMVQKGKIVSCREVYEEIMMGDDELVKWAKENKDIFLPADQVIQVEVRNILVKFPDLINVKKRKNNADPFIIAVAKVFSCTLITQETKAGYNNPPKIPNVCDYYGIKYINLVQFMHEIKLQLM